MWRVCRGDYECDGLLGWAAPDCVDIAEAEPSGSDCDPTQDHLALPEGPSKLAPAQADLREATRPAACATSPWSPASWLWPAIPVLWSRRRSQRS